MDLGNGLGHLPYSTLVHPGDTWDALWKSITTYLPRVKARISPNAPFGVSLRLSARTAQTLVSDRAARERLSGFLADNDLYVYTANAFPYGTFKDTRVKEQVYEPDWRSEERTAYTINVADILAEIAPEGGAASIQTAPLGFKPRVTGPDVVDSFTDHVLRVVAHLVTIEARTGRLVSLALEPELADLRRRAWRRRARTEPLGAAPVVHYLLRLRAEVRLLQRAVWGLALGAPTARRRDTEEET